MSDGVTNITLHFVLLGEAPKDPSISRPLGSSKRVKSHLSGPYAGTGLRQGLKTSAAQTQGDGQDLELERQHLFTIC